MINLAKPLYANIIATALGQGILLVTLPLNAYKYSPEIYGEYYYIVYLISILVVIFSFRLEVILQVFSKPIVNYILKKLTILGALLNIPLLLLQGDITVITSIAVTQIILFVSSFGLLRADRFILCIFTRVGSPVFLSIILFSETNFDLVYAWFFTNNVIFYIFIIIFWVRPLQFMNIIKFSDVISAIKPRIKNYYWISIIDNVNISLPIIYFYNFVSDNFVGQYVQIQKLYSAPLLFFSAVITPLLLRYGMKAYEENRNIRSMNYIILSLSITLSLFTVILILLFHDAVTELLFSNFLKLSSWWSILIVTPVLLRLLVSPFASVFIVTEQYFHLYMFVLVYFVLSNILLSGLSILSVNTVLVCLVLCDTLMYSYYFFASYREAKIRKLI